MRACPGRWFWFFFFFQAEDGIRDRDVTGVQTCALPIYFARNGALTWQYRNAGPGNVALIGELPRRAVVALGFGSSAEAAATLAISSLIQPFDNVLQQQISDWEGWQTRCAERSPPTLGLPDAIREQAVVSSIVLRAHLDKTYQGAMVASLSVPWGYTGNER